MAETPGFFSAQTGGMGFMLMASLLFFIPAVIIVWVFTFAMGAARLAYNTHKSGIFAIIAFLLPPLYYVYYAFTK